jgi:MFS family permease
MILAGGSSNRFVVLFLVDGATFLALVPLLLIFKVGTRSKVRSNTAPLVAASAGYRLIFRDTLFLRIWLLMAALVTIGFAQLHASFPVFATKPGGITASALGIAYAANAFTVVTAQLLVLKAAQGHRRTTAVMMVCALWATAWAIALVAGSLGSGWLAIGAFTVALVVFALGETAFTPTLTPMVNDLAPEALRGRYNGALATAWTAGFVLGPAVAGKTLAMGFGNALYVVLICLLAVVALAAWRLSRLLPGSADEIGYGLGGQEASDLGELDLPMKGVPNVS